MIRKRTVRGVSRMRGVAAGLTAACVVLAACGSSTKSSSTATSASTAAAANTAAVTTAGAGTAAAGTAAGGTTAATMTAGTTAGTPAAGATDDVIPVAGNNPNGYGQDAGNPKLYKGAGGFQLDTSKCPSDWNPTGGITDKTIKLFSALPLSGPIAAIGAYGEGMKSYFQYINAHGGIDGRNVDLTVNDNQYKPDLTKTIADAALADGSYMGSVGINGTPMNLAIWDEMNQECVPMLLTGSGAAQWGDVKGHPWTGPGLTFTYIAESRIQAEWLKQKFPNGAKIVTITINNDFGKQYLSGLKAAVKGTNLTIVGSELHDPAAPNLDNEFTSAAATNADVLVLESSGTPCTQVLASLERSSWKPTFILPNSCQGTAIFKPLIAQGLTGKGAYVVQTSIAPNDPSVKTDPFVAAYYSFLPTIGLDPNNTQYAAGWQFAWAATEILKVASTYKGGLNRANVILAHRAMDQTLPLLLPGLSFKSNGTTDAYLFEGGQMAQYDVTDPANPGTFKKAGDLINFEGQLGTFDNFAAAIGG